MRQFKFRVYDKLHKKMEYDPSFSYDEERISCIYFKDNDNYAIEDAVVMQWSGLQDKNGKDIYEGDIITAENRHGHIYRGQVFFTDGAFYMTYEDRPPKQITSGDHISVSGNIFQDPDLLETYR